MSDVVVGGFRGRWMTVMALLLTATGLAGCGRSRPARFYLLGAGPASARVEPAAAAATTTTDTQVLPLVVLPVVLPEYLNRTQIVTRTNGAQLEIHEYDRWAEPLGDSVTRELIGALQARLPGRYVMPGPSELGVMRLHIELDRFDATAGGEVVLTGRYWGDTVQNPAHFDLRRPAGTQIEDQVAAMQKLLGELAGQIAAGVAARL